MRVTWIVGAGFAILLAAACGGIGTSSGGGGFYGVGPDAGHGHGSWVSVGDAAGDARGDGEAGMPLPLWSPPDAGPPPVVACGAGAIDSGGADAVASDAAAPDAAAPDAAAEGGALCPLPASQCLGAWLVSYSGGSCQNGLCVFTQHVINCYGGSCNNGFCSQVPASE